MKYSKLFGKTIRDAPSNTSFRSHELLIQAGFIRESVAGRYFFLPLGMKIRNKIQNIIREEMNAIGGQEMIAPFLHPLELWEETNRTEAVNFELMRIKDRRDAEFALGGTAEEMIVDVVRRFQLSYRDLPFSVYQFSQKFRDEMRARGGLLRAREFLMKDAYSFHEDAEDFEKEYKNQWEAYTKIFNRLGLKTKAVAADGGYIGGDYCHEFVVDSEVGGSRYLESGDGSYVAHEDVADFVHEDVNVDEGEKEFEIIEQPKWVKTMEDNVKHYKKDEKAFLKNVVYRNYQGDIIIATIRGDMDVNPIKLKNLLGEGADLFDADEEDLKAIGTQAGYVHSWGHEFVKKREAQSEDRLCKVIYVADNSLKTVKNFIGGQKEDDTDSINVNYGRDFKHDIEGDIAMAQEGYLAPDGESRLVERRGIEVGNIFQLGCHYSKKMDNAEYVTEDGKKQEFYMGCYGIGLGRTLATVAEIYNDDNGLIWPISIAPYTVHIVSLGDNEKVVKRAEGLYEELKDENIEVLWDDREESAGVKFADADLIGCPIRLVVSDRSIKEGGVEVKLRSDDSKGEVIKDAQLFKHIKDKIHWLYKDLF